MLTARDEVDDRLRGFAEGVDDYVVKPFAMAELRRAGHRGAAAPRARSPR